MGTLVWLSLLRFGTMLTHGKKLKGKREMQGKSIAKVVKCTIN